VAVCDDRHLPKGTLARCAGTSRSTLPTVAVLICLLAACGGAAQGSPASGGASAAAPAPLVVSAIPDQDPQELQRLYGSVAGYLEQRLDVPVEYVPVTDYNAAVSLFRTGDLDLVWFGGLTGVQARLQTPGARVLAQRDIDAEFHSVFIVNASTGLEPGDDVEDLDALRGLRFTFGSESSTSGRLMPQHFLDQAGVAEDDFAGAPGFSGSHDKTIDLVESGSFEAGVLNEQVWTSRVAAGDVDQDRVKLFLRTPAITTTTGSWVPRPSSAMARTSQTRCVPRCWTCHPTTSRGRRCSTCSARRRSSRPRRRTTTRSSRSHATSAWFGGRGAARRPGTRDPRALGHGRCGVHAGARRRRSRGARGERVALVGPSGAGKTTLLMVINGTVVPDRGAVTVLGSAPGTADRRRRTRVGTVYQQLHLVGPLQVVHNVNAGRLPAWSLGRALWSQVRPSAMTWPRPCTTSRPRDHAGRVAGGGHRGRGALTRPFRVASVVAAGMDRSRNHRGRAVAGRRGRRRDRSGQHRRWAAVAGVRRRRGAT
jgi:phosphonate transport system substrate-binding protein